jgi:hypothetical protein
MEDAYEGNKLHNEERHRILTEKIQDAIKENLVIANSLASIKTENQRFNVNKNYERIH